MLARLSLIAILCSLTLSLYAAEMVPGSIRVARVIGDVYYVESPEAPQKTLLKGQALTQGSTVITKIDSKAILLFPSGSTLLIKPESRVFIEEYMEDTTQGPQGLPESNTSKTQLRLIEGDIVGSVKRLSDTGSFEIHSLAYSAGIRGTSWWMKLRKTQHFEMISQPRPSGGRAYKTIPTDMEVDWGFGVAEGSAMLSGPGMEPILVGDETVVNVNGMLSPEDTIDGTSMGPGIMPETQHEAIMSATSMMQDMMTKNP